MPDNAEQTMMKLGQQPRMHNAGSMSAPALELLEPRQLLSAASASSASPWQAPMAAGPSHIVPFRASRHKSFPTPALSSVNDWVYQLQNINLTALAATRFDLAVIDYSQDGSDAQAFSKKQITALEQSGPRGKNVLAYMSVGEAENYRYYWNNTWDPTNSGKPSNAAPAWLGPVNPDWPGNYSVKFWDPAWQKIVFSYTDKVIGNGFNGVYLDVIDVYQFWGPGGASGLNRASAEQEVVNFVEAITNYARAKKPGFEVFVQNAEEIAADYPAYVAAVDGIGKEDTWYNGNSANKKSEINFSLENLDIFKRAGKLVLSMDYTTKTKTINDYYAKALAKGYVPYASVRDLDRLTINPGHAPD